MGSFIQEALPPREVFVGAQLASTQGAGKLPPCGRIVTGLQLADNRRILSGALPAVLLAVAVDALLGALERALRPRGL